MNISILTLGTRGDVQPYVALALGFRNAGHSVTVGSSCDFALMVESHGLRFAPFRLSIRSLLEAPDARAAFVSKRAAIRLARRVRPQMPGFLDDAWAAAQGADVLLYHPKILNGLDIAEKLNIPSFLAFYLPGLSRTRAFPAPFLAGPANWGELWNKASHSLFLRLLTAPYHRMTNRWRTGVLRLPGRSFWAEAGERYGRAVPKLYGYSQHLVPTPSDWDDSAHVTGQWFLDEPSLRPPAHLTEFLANGPAPVFVGFGSIAGRDPAHTTSLVIEALRISGQRGVLVGGWGGLCSANTPGTVCFVESVPYAWLLPQMAAVVHHGGAGSTGEGLRAGKPTVICPFFGDQVFWGRRVHALGAGPRPLPQAQLTVNKLAEAIREAVNDCAMQERAAELGRQIRTEAGVERAVEVVEAHVRAAR